MNKQTNIRTDGFNKDYIQEVENWYARRYPDYQSLKNRISEISANQMII